MVFRGRETGRGRVSSHLAEARGIWVGEKKDEVEDAGGVLLGTEYKGSHLSVWDTGRSVWIHAIKQNGLLQEPRL